MLKQTKNPSDISNKALTIRSKRYRMGLGGQKHMFSKKLSGKVRYNYLKGPTQIKYMISNEQQK